MSSVFIPAFVPFAVHMLSAVPFAAGGVPAVPGRLVLAQAVPGQEGAVSGATLLAAALVLLVGAGVAVLVVLARRGHRGDPLVADVEAGIRAVGERMAALEAALDVRHAELVGSVRSVDRRVETVGQVFGNDRARGAWAEISLRRVLELCGLAEGRDFVLQESRGGSRPDAVVLLPDDRRLVIDAKFPVTRFVEAAAVDDPTERDRLLALHAGEIEREARGLIDRGYLAEAAGGFVVMYLPSEQLYIEAMRVRPALVERLLRLRVLLAGPVTLMAVLGAAAQVLVEARAVAEAREIVDDAKELRTRLATFAGHLDKVGRGLRSAVEAYNGAVGSYERRVLPKAGSLAERVGVEVPPPPGAVESMPRVSDDHYPASA